MEKEKVIDGLFELYAFEGLNNEEKEIVKEAIKIMLKETRVLNTGVSVSPNITTGTIKTDTVRAPYSVNL